MYIKREDAISRMSDLMACDMSEYFTDIPSADVVERKRGKWIKDADGCMVCSECGNPDEINGITGEFMGSNFCNECGADMRGAE